MVWNIFLVHYFFAVCIAYGSSSASEVTLPTPFKKGFADEKQITYGVNKEPRKYYRSRDQFLLHSLRSNHQTSLPSFENHKEHDEEKVRGKESFRLPRMRKSLHRLKQVAHPRLKQEDVKEQISRHERFALSSSEPTSPEEENQQHWPDSEVASPSILVPLLKTRDVRNVSSMNFDAAADAEIHLREISEIESKGHSPHSPSVQILKSVRALPMKMARTENSTSAVSPELPLSSVTVALPLEFSSQSTELFAVKKPALTNTQQPGDNPSRIETLQLTQALSFTSDGILYSEEGTVIPVSSDVGKVSQLNTSSIDVQPEAVNGSGNYRLLKYYKDLLSSEKNLKMLQHFAKSVLKGNVANQIETANANSSIKTHIRNHSLPDNNTGISDESTTSYPFNTNTDELLVATQTVSPHTPKVASSDYSESSNENNSLGSAPNEPFRSANKYKSEVSADNSLSTYTSIVVTTIIPPLITSSDNSADIIEISTSVSIDTPVIRRSFAHGKEKSVASNSDRLTTSDTFSKDSNSNIEYRDGQTDIVGSEEYPQSATDHTVGVADFGTTPSPTFAALMKFFKNFKSYLYSVEPVRQPATESFNMGDVWAALKNDTSSNESGNEKTDYQEHLTSEVSASKGIIGQETPSSSGSSLVKKSVDETKEGAERVTASLSQLGVTIVTDVQNKAEEAVSTTEPTLGEKNLDQASTTSSDMKSDKDILLPRSSDGQSSLDKNWYDSQNDSDSLERYAELVKLYNRLRGQYEAENHVNAGNVTSASPVSKNTFEESKDENQSSSDQLFQFVKFLGSKPDETNNEAERSRGNLSMGRSAQQFHSSSPRNPIIQSKNNSFENQRKADTFLKFANFLRKNQCISGKCSSSNNQARDVDNGSIIQDSSPEPRSADAQSNLEHSLVENPNNTEDFHKFAAFLRESIPDASEGKTQDSLSNRSKNISHPESASNSSYSRYKFIHFLANRGKQRTDSSTRGNRIVSERLAPSDRSAITEPTERQHSFPLSRERIAIIEVSNSTLTSVPQHENSTANVLPFDVNTLTPLDIVSSERAVNLSTDDPHLHLSVSNESTPNQGTTAEFSTSQKPFLLTNITTQFFSAISENATEVIIPAANATLPVVNESSSTNATLLVVNESSSTNATLPVVNESSSTNATKPVVNESSSTNATKPVVNESSSTNVSVDFSTSTEHLNVTSSSPNLFPASESSETISDTLFTLVPLKDNITNSSVVPVDNNVTLSFISLENSSDSSVFSSKVSVFDVTPSTANTSANTTTTMSTLPILIAKTGINSSETTRTPESLLARTDYSTMVTDSSAFTTDFSTLMTEVITNSEDLTTYEVLNSTTQEDIFTDATQTADRVAGSFEEKTSSQLHDHTSLAVAAGIGCFALLVIFIGIAVARKAARERKKSKYLVPSRYSHHF